MNVYNRYRDDKEFNEAYDNVFFPMYLEQKAKWENQVGDLVKMVGTDNYSFLYKELVREKERVSGVNAYHKRWYFERYFLLLKVESFVGKKVQYPGIRMWSEKDPVCPMLALTLLYNNEIFYGVIYCHNIFPVKFDLVKNT